MFVPIVLCFLCAALAHDATMTVSDTVIGQSDPTIVGFNFDWHERTHESPKWNGNSSVLTADFAHPRMRAAASALAGSVLRIGGTPADAVIYNVVSGTCDISKHDSAHYCLGMKRWDELRRFTKDMGLHLVFGLNAGTGRSNSTPKDFDDIEKFLKYTVETEAETGPVYGFEFGNEKSHIDVHVSVTDYRNLMSLIKKYWPGDERPLLIGNDLLDNGPYLESWLPLVVQDDSLDVVTYHVYFRNSEAVKMTDYTKPSVVNDFATHGKSQGVRQAHQNHAPHLPLWMGEGALGSNGGIQGGDNTFQDSFWYANSLAVAIRTGHSRFQRQAFVGGGYELVNHDTQFGPYLRPNPDYFIALLFHDLVGSKALETTNALFSNTNFAYSFCHSRTPTHITILAINVDATNNFDVEIVLDSEQELNAATPRQDYVITSHDDALDSYYIDLNGKLVDTDNSVNIPSLVPAQRKGNVLQLKPYSIVFSVFELDSPLSACS